MTMIIYKATNTNNGKSYIGYTRLTLDERKYKHLKDCKLDNFKHRKFYAALNEHGEQAFIWEVIDSASDKAEAIEKEKHWISFCNSCRHGYNANTGGSGTNGYPYSNETRQKMSEAKLGIPKSDEQKKAMSLSAVGKHQGELSGMAKLTNAEVMKIKHMIAMKSVSINDIAAKFAVHPSTISNIKKGRIWKHIKLET